MIAIVFRILFALSMLALGVLVFAIDFAIRWQTLRSILSRGASGSGPRGGFLARARRLVGWWRRGLGVVGGQLEQARKDSLKDGADRLGATVVVGRKG